MKGAKITVKDKGANKLLAQAQALAGGLGVRVGILDDEPKRTTGESTDLTLVEVAAIHEFGAPGAGIPQRSFIRATVDNEAQVILALQRALATQVVKQGLPAREALDLLGAKVAGMIQRRTPIDTGQLRSGVTWKVGKVEGR